ncbi:nitroreductase [Ligilactobacillus equi]|uniref:nitroreductase family protein n=1 Tax=Ligilactobacillus equi TaxID=137357 RepID=UPI002ED29767
MNLHEIMERRYTVRKYKKQSLSQADIDAIVQEVANLNQQFALSMKLITNEDDLLSKFAKLFMAQNASNAILLEGQDDEKLGYSAAKLMLFVQERGINSWFIGGTYNQKKFSNAKAIIVIGYGKNIGKPHKSKAISQVSDYITEMPEWYLAGIQALLLAPTALNKQNFQIKYNEGDPILDVKVSDYSGLEKGILKYYFESISKHKLSSN